MELASWIIGQVTPTCTDTGEKKCQMNMSGSGLQIFWDTNQKSEPLLSVFPEHGWKMKSLVMKQNEVEM